MRGVLLVLSFLVLFVLSNCSEQPTSVSDTQGMDGALSKPSVSDYIPDTDITEQLRNDLNAGLDITIPPGEYYVSESIIIEGYSGTLKGSGKDVTIIKVDENFKKFKPLIDPWLWEYEMAEIFAIYWSKGDVTVKDMTILVIGDAPAELHNNPWAGEVTTIDNAFWISGIHPEHEGSITITIKNIKVKGNFSNDPTSHNGKNLLYPIIAAGWFGPRTLPVNAIIMDCETENSGFNALEAIGLRGGVAEIKNNKITNSFWGIWMNGNDPLTEVTIKNNIFQNIDEPEHVIDILNPNWVVCIKNNTLEGVPIPDDCK